MRSKLVTGLALILVLFAWTCGVGSAQDACLDRLTIDHPEWCLNAKSLKTPQACRDNSKPVARPAIDLVPILAPPPLPDSAAQKQDIEAVLDAQARRTPAEVRCARADACISIFRFAGVMGPEFKPENLPLTSAMIKTLAGATGGDIAYAKATFKRPRPFSFDSHVKNIVPQCPDFSYPSGHSTFAYAVATLLADMVPEKAPGIFKRADQYAHNRVVAGVHYPSDVAAGRISAAVIDYTLMQDGEFQQRYKAARQELRTALGLGQN